jgi:hypothetical protein
MVYSGMTKVIPGFSAFGLEITLALALRRSLLRAEVP